MRREGAAESAVADASWCATVLAEASPVLAVITVIALLALSVLCGATNRLGPGRPGMASGPNRTIERARHGRTAEEVEPLREEEVLGVWLAAELRSRRFGARLKAKLAELGCDESLVDDGALDDPTRRQQLRALISARGVVWDHALPAPLSGWRWQRETHRVGRLVECVRYGPHAGWITMSGGTRLPQDVALRCRAGLLDAEHTRLFEQIAAAYRLPGPVSSIILLDEPDGTLTALEGDARLTDLALAMLNGPLPFDTVEVVVGYGTQQGRAVSRFSEGWSQVLSWRPGMPDAPTAAPGRIRRRSLGMWRNRVSATRSAHSPPEKIRDPGPRCRPPAIS